MRALPSEQIERNSHLAVIIRLREAIEKTLADLIDPSLRFALLDFPHHNNIGDSAIYLGELAYFDRCKIRPAYVSTIDDFDPITMEVAIGEGPIYMHGGGNFGDVWPWFQPFRESILERYKGRRVIQLPQTLHYSSQDRIDQTARIIEKHGAYTLLVRDQPSYELAKRSFQCDVRLCPDMAFNIEPVKRSGFSYELLLHLRTDKESTGARTPSALIDDTGVLLADWPRESKRHMLKQRAKAVVMLQGAAFDGRNAYQEAFYRALAKLRFSRGIKLLGSANAVVTDRLHGHIMSTLMGLPHAVLDNSYGKTSNFITAWETLTDRSHLAGSVNEAAEILRQQEKLRLKET